MNISSLSSNIFQIEINQKLPKIEVNFAQTEQIKQDENVDRFGRKIEYYDHYSGFYGDINTVQKYHTKTHTKEAALDEFIARQTIGILSGSFLNSTFGVSDIKGISEVKEHTATIEDVEYPTFVSGYFMDINYYRYGKIPQEYYLNSYANSNLIDTKFGKAELFLDLADNNDKLGVGTFSSNSQLFRFDSDGNGFVDKNDDYFDKLKIRAYDKDGNEIIKKLSEVVDSIDLKDFIDSKSNAIKKWKEEVSSYGWDEKTYEEQLNIISSYNPYSIFKPEVRYESLSQNDLNELSKLADKDGWIDVTSLQGIDLAYAKQGIDGNYKLNELNYLGISNNQANSYANEQYVKFNALYEDYMAEINALNEFFNSYKQVANDDIMAEFGAFIENPEFKSTIMLQIEREFTSATGLKFSLENLQKVKDSFEQDRANTANMLKDTDVLTAIRINKNGTFTLKFNSGREINVNELYKDSGKAFDIELNLNAKFMSEIELNQNLDLVVSLAKVKDEITGNIQTKPLKELGVEIIKKLSNNKFILQTNDNRSIIIDQLYTKLNDKEKDQNSNKNQIDDKEKFYPKPLKIWA